MLPDARAFTYIFAAVMLALSAQTPGATQKNGLRDRELRRLYHSLQKPIPADSAWAIRDTLLVQLPDFKATLHSGKITVLLDSTQTVTGLLFEGQAHIEFRPPHALEQFQFSRFAKDSLLSCTASQILWRFSRLEALSMPGASRSISNAAQFPRIHAPLHRKSQDWLSEISEALLEHRGYNLAAQLLRRRVEETPSAFVLCAFYPDRDLNPFPPLYLYFFDSAAEEPITLLQYFPKRIGRPFYTVCSYKPTHDPPPRQPAPQLMRYTGWVELDGGGNMEADLGVNIALPQTKPRTLSFALSTEIDLAWVRSEQGDTLDFIRAKKETDITVFLPAPAVSADTLRLLFHYDGDMLQRHENGSLFLKDPVFWVPRLGYLNRAHYSIVFKCPPRMRVLTGGRLVRDWQEGGFHLSFYRSFLPAKAATFCLGNFSADTLLASPELGLPQIEIYSMARRALPDRKRVAKDLASSLYFFQNHLGDFPLPVLRVVESPTMHSQGFPGFVTLSWLGFAGHVAGPTEALRSHEVAHQWFGNLLGWSTYHDQWLSEAFAEYLGALYVEWVLREDKRFDEMLQAWNNDLLNRGNVGVSIGMQRFGFSKQALRKSEGEKAGPVWMGVRLGQKEPLDYYMQTYEKGAYVLHMLRWLLRDLGTDSDQRFWALLADFLRRYQAAEPASADFQKIAESHYGASLDWFFQQWIFATDIPTYTWSYTILPAALEQPTSPVGLPVASFGVEPRQEAQLVRVQVRQENVPPHFEMPIPITVEYADGVRDTRRVLVNHEGGVLEFPAYPAKVTRVLFNTGNAVLCRVVNN